MFLIKPNANKKKDTVVRDRENLLLRFSAPSFSGGKGKGQKPTASCKIPSQCRRRVQNCSNSSSPLAWTYFFFY